MYFKSAHNRSTPLENASSHSRNGNEQEIRCIAKVGEGVKRVGRAHKISKVLEKVEKIAEKVEQKLDGLGSELRIILGARIPQSRADAEVFKPSLFVPDNLTHTVLDFESSSTLEGRLTAMLLTSWAHGIVGLGGLCKIKELAEMTKVPGVNARFGGGVHFLSLGQEVTETKIVEAIANAIEAANRIDVEEKDETEGNSEAAGSNEHAISERTSATAIEAVERCKSARRFRPPPASEIAEMVRRSISLRDAAKIAVRRFSEKPCLFFCDDLWPEEHGARFFQDLRFLIETNPWSRIVITLRESHAAAKSGCRIWFNINDLQADLVLPGYSGTVADQKIKTYAIVGEGGVGKTVSMSALATEQEICTKFSGGIYFMSLSEEAKTMDVTAEMERLVKEANGKRYSRSVCNAHSAEKAAQEASKWFSNGPCLFLCDDLWASESDAGFFTELRILTTAHSESKMVITTRDSSIANQADYVLSANTREPIGSASKNIFLLHSRIQDKPHDHEFTQALNELLRSCGGLPLFLAVVGRRLAEEHTSDETNVRLGNQVRKLNDKKWKVLQERLPGNHNSSLHRAVMLSVKFLENKLPRAKYSVTDMFCSLSILSKQGWIPVTVLNQLWQTNARDYVEHFNRLRLVTLRCKTWRSHRYGEEKEVEREEDGVMLHDLTLDICRLEAISTNNEKFWHKALLDSYFKVGYGRTLLAKFSLSRSKLNVRDAHRPWWNTNVCDDGYILNNLSRHLVSAGLHKELWSLLLNPMWSKMWIVFGTTLPLQRDLRYLVEAMSGVREVSKKDGRKLTELKHVYSAVLCSWGRIEKNAREYPYQLLGRLYDARAGMPIVEFFLKRVETTAERPWLRPRHQCFEDPRGSLHMEVYFANRCHSVAYFPCGKEVAAAVGKQVHVINVECGQVMKKLTGHGQPVRKVAVSADGTWIASADDRDIRVWAKRTGFQIAGAIACDNSLEPKNGSLVIREGDRDAQIFTVIRRKLKAWDLSSGTEITCNFDGFANFMAFSAEGQELICASTQSKTVNVRKMDNTSLIVETMPYPTDGGYITCLAVSPDGKSIACGTHTGEIVFWDRSCREIQVTELSGNEGAVIALEITKNAKLLFSGSDNGDVRMWDLENRNRPGKLIGRHTNMVMCLAASPDCTRLASASGDQTMRVWNVMQSTWEKDTGRRWTGHSRPVTCISSSPDGRFVVSGSSDTEVRVWDARTGELIGKPLTGHPVGVTKVAVSDDSTIIYSWSGVIDICWYLETRQTCSYEDYNFNVTEDGGKNDQQLTLKQAQNNVWECHYEPSDGMKYVVAQMPSQEKPLKWHIDQDRQVVYVGRQDGSITILKIEP